MRPRFLSSERRAGGDRGGRSSCSATVQAVSPRQDARAAGTAASCDAAGAVAGSTVGPQAGRHDAVPSSAVEVLAAAVAAGCVRNSVARFPLGGWIPDPRGSGVRCVLSLNSRKEYHHGDQEEARQENCCEEAREESRQEEVTAAAAAATNKNKPSAPSRTHLRRQQQQQASAT